MTDGLTVDLCDATGPAPAGWDDFLAAGDLLPAWSWDLVHAVADGARVPVVTAVVRDGARPVALVTGRFVGPRHRHGAVPAAGVIDLECPLSSALPGLVLADDAPPALRTEALEAFRLAVARRWGRRVTGLLLRQVPEAHLPAVLHRPAVVREGKPIAVFRNRFTDFDAYLASLSGKRRRTLRRMLHEVDTEVDVRFVVGGDTREGAVGPAPSAAEITALANRVVLRRHVRSLVLRPRVADARVTAALLAHPGALRRTYADADGRLLGVALGFHSRRSGLAGLWGTVAPSEGGRRFLWFHAMASHVRWCIETGRESAVIGQGNADEKARLGCDLDRQWAVLVPQGRPARPTHRSGPG